MGRTSLEGRGARERAALEMFKRWLDARGGTGSIEVDQHVQAIRRVLLADGPSRFVALKEKSVFLGSCEEEENPKRPVLHRAGWRRPSRDGRDEYLIPPEVWREGCAKLGVDPTETARTLRTKGYLTGGDGKNLTTTVRVPNIGKIRVYVIGPDLLGTAHDAVAEDEA